MFSYRLGAKYKLKFIQPKFSFKSIYWELIIQCMLIMVTYNFLFKNLLFIFSALLLISTSQAKDIAPPIISTPKIISPSANVFDIAQDVNISEAYNHCPKITATHNPYIMHSQADIDVFAKYAECSLVPYLWISGDDITNLNALNNIVEVTGGELYRGFEIFIGASRVRNGKAYYNSNLKILSGLSRLTRVMGGIYVYGNSAMSEINAFNNLATVKGNINIQDNMQLESAQIFSQLTDVGGDVYIEDNSKVINFKSSFTKLNHIGGSLRLSNQSIGASPRFTKLNNIYQDLYIRNTQLYDLTPLALNSLTNVGGKIEICDNFSLTSLKGITNLDELGSNNSSNLYDLVIGKNPKLNDCSQLSNLYSPSKDKRYYFNSAPNELPSSCKASFERM